MTYILKEKETQLVWRDVSGLTFNVDQYVSCSRPFKRLIYGLKCENIIVSKWERLGDCDSLKIAFADNAYLQEKSSLFFTIS